jgi:hypothetical protein
LERPPGYRAELGDWLARKLRPTFARRILAITADVILKWRLIVEEGRKVGHTYSQPDLFMAAQAMHHGLTVVTRGADDYRLAASPSSTPGRIPRRPDVRSANRSANGRPKMLGPRRHLYLT